MGIKVTKEGFVWKIIGPLTAQELFNTRVFELFELREDGSESLIETADQMGFAIKDEAIFGIEVGHLDPSPRKRVLLKMLDEIKADRIKKVKADKQVASEIDKIKKHSLLQNCNICADFIELSEDCVECASIKGNTALFKKGVNEATQVSRLLTCYGKHTVEGHNYLNIFVKVLETGTVLLQVQDSITHVLIRLRNKEDHVLFNDNLSKLFLRLYTGDVFSECSYLLLESFKHSSESHTDIKKAYHIK